MHTHFNKFESNVEFAPHFIQLFNTWIYPLVHTHFFMPLEENYAI
jgi:hypothetical protein